MNDNEFRLTPADVRGQEFRRAALGYDITSVEEFRGRIAEELERLFRERAALRNGSAASASNSRLSENARRR